MKFYLRKISIIFLPINLNMCFGAQKNRLIETVLLITHNICFGWEIKKIIFLYTLLSGGLECKFLCFRLSRRMFRSLIKSFLRFSDLTESKQFSWSIYFLAIAFIIRIGLNEMYVWFLLAYLPYFF